MPTIMDNLNELTNEQLHHRLLQYGMANIPVTTSTRNVLIKRLRHTMDMANNKTRRETIHVSKLSSEDESESDAFESAGVKKKKAQPRRATIAPSAPTPPRKMRASATPPPVQLKAITTRRNSGRITPLADKEIAPIKLAESSSLVSNFAIEEESDIDEIPTTHRMREPSMGKSETVVTSFQHNIASTPIVLDVNDDEEYDKRSLELESSNDVEPLHTTERTLNAPAGYANAYSTQQKRFYPSAENASENIGRPSNSTSYNTSYRQADAYQRPTIASTSSFRSPRGDIDDLDINEAPYFIDFTRRLKRLQAEPLIITPIKDDLSQSYAYRPSGRKSLAKKPDESLWCSFVTMLQTFNQQYGHLVIFFLLVFVAIVCYVMFSMNE